MARRKTIPFSGGVSITGKRRKKKPPKPIRVTIEPQSSHPFPKKRKKKSTTKRKKK